MSAELPERVRLGDGRTEPFEPERITRSLFAAAERAGPADAFLSRELTEGVLHFLAAESVGPETTAGEIADVVGKVVRELGQPAIARAYDERSAATQNSVPTPAAIPTPTWLSSSRPALEVTRAAAADRLTEYSLDHIYPRDLASAHRESLIRLTDLATPFELAGLVVPPNADLIEARSLAGEFVAFDGPEFDLAVRPGEPAVLARGFVRELERAAQVTGLTVILNINVTDPPRLAQGAGPLFGPASARDPRRREIADALWTAARDRVRAYWHVSGTEDLRVPGPNVELVFDRPKVPVVLGPGLDRSTPAVLTQVGLNLARLLDQLGGPPVSPDVFLTKVASLARFAKTAGHVRQDFLRKHARRGVREAFVLDRARLVLVPIGLTRAAGASDQPSADFARDIVKAIRTAAENDRPRVLPVRVDSPMDDWGGVAVAGGTAKQQIRAASHLHGAAGAGAIGLGWGDVTEAEGLTRAAFEAQVSRLRNREDS